MNAISPCTAVLACAGSQSYRQSGKVLELPVAARVNARLRFASTARAPQALLPQEAANRLDDLLSRGAAIGEVRLSGPGDPLADIHPTLETCRLVRDRHADLRLGITTLGINAEAYADTLAEHGVCTVTLLVEAVDPEVVKNLYAWIRPGTRTIPLSQAATMLVEEQQRAIAALQVAGLTITVRTTVYPGINDDHVEQIAARLAELGVKKMVLLPCPSCPDEPDAPNAPDSARMTALAGLAGRYLATASMAPPAADPGAPRAAAGGAAAGMLQQPSTARPNVAVVSASGMDIDLHLGQAGRALIYGPREDGLPCLLATRPLPPPGGGSARWEKLADVLADCFVLLSSGAGDNPRKVLAGRGITVLIADGNVEGTVDVLYGGGKKGKQCRK